MASLIKPAWQRWGRFMIPSVVAVVLLAMIMLPAQAVHNVGVFELDTPSANAVNNPAVQGDDWDNVCHEKVGSDCGTTSNTSGATAVAWAADGDPNATIFTGGGSKDPSDLSSWRWKDGAGGLPDKDNLSHAFAARYSTASSAECPAADNTTDGTKPCDVLYFGMDRFDNSGDAQLGFWFLQNPLAANGGSSGGGFKFTDGQTPAGAPAHKEGDLLILSDFSVGGTTSTIDLYKWVDSGGDVSTHLLSLGGGDNKDCGVITGTDPFCGVVNKGPSNTTSPWTFHDKSGNDAFAPGELYEGGVNLSHFNLNGECFATLVAESRSSTSPTATLKDFVLGGFGACTSSMTTAQTWTPSDSATITVGGKSTWTGNVTFTLYPNGTCDTADTPLWTSSAIGVSDSDATASTDDSTTLTDPPGVTASGTYSWQVDFVHVTSGVPDKHSCVEATTLSIDNDTSS